MNSSNKIIFGSCNKQIYKQDYWGNIKLFDPNVFIWIGDAVYTKSTKLSELSQAFYNQSSNPYYQSFIKDRLVYGTWDDHDLGVNDAGKSADNINERKQLFVQFLNNNNKNVSDNNTIYKSFIYMASNRASIKVILLDTRSYRHDPYLSFIGKVHFPYSGLLSGIIRAIYSYLGLNKSFKGDILGELQWRWLEIELNNTNTDFTIIASSIQVLTTNTAVESWNQYPESKKRLLNLIATYNPSGLFIISGDVHFAEISKANIKYSNNQSVDLYEITSSGMTHSVSGNIITRGLFYLCSILFQSHQRDQDSIYFDKNFGMIEFPLYDKNMINISIYSMNSFKPVMSQLIYKSQSINNEILNYKLTSHDFYHINYYDIFIYIILLIILINKLMK